MSTAGYTCNLKSRNSFPFGDAGTRHFLDYVNVNVIFISDPSCTSTGCSISGYVNKRKITRVTVKSLGNIDPLCINTHEYHLTLY